MHTLLALNWEPQLRGILIIIIAVSVLCGSVYLILGTNLGARLGFLVALASLSGWVMLMALTWWAFGIGLKGAEPSWKPVPGQSILLDADAIHEVGVVSAPVEIPEGATYAEQAAAIDEALVNNGWRRLTESDPSFGQSAASGGVVIEEDGTLKAGAYQVVAVFDKGGGRYPKISESLDFLAFRHNPHYILVEVAPLVIQRSEPGRAPARAEIDTTQPHRYVYMIRDLGNKRVPAAIVAFGAGLIFFACCYLLHSRDRRVLVNRSAALAIPAKE
jgi:hypothetical protein